MTTGLFLLVLILSLFFYLLRDEKFVFDDAIVPSHDPRIVLQNFILTKFDGETVISQIRGAKAALLTPRLLEMPSYVTGWRVRDGKKESFEANLVKAELDSVQMSDLSGRVNVKNAFFGDSVMLSIGELVLETQEARYLGDQSRMIVGDKFVMVYGPGRWVSGEKGFEFNMNDEDLSLFGKIKGVTTPDAN